MNVASRVGLPDERQDVDSSVTAALDGFLGAGLRRPAHGVVTVVPVSYAVTSNTW